jgi:hypothetical protein
VHPWHGLTEHTQEVYASVCHLKTEEGKEEMDTLAKQTGQSVLMLCGITGSQRSQHYPQRPAFSFASAQSKTDVMMD